MSYDAFAGVYDRLMADAEYPRRVAYVEELFHRHDRMPTLLLDLACGTGSFSVAFAQKGVQVVGADPSPEMLWQAQNKALAAGVEVLFLCQAGEELDLYGTVDGAICMLDSINHIANPQTLAAALERVALFLEPGRVVVFDVNTPYKHREILADNTFVLEDEDVYCVWQNTTEEDLTQIDIDFFCRQEGEVYTRQSEQFFERAYPPEALDALLQAAGLETVAVYGDLSFDPPEAETGRVYYVTRKRG